MTDILKRYLLADRRIRVQAVRLEQAWQAGLAHQALPAPVRDLLGELCAAAVLLAASLKFDGSVILQIQGDGPVALLVAECTAQLGVRATASLREGAAIAPDAPFQTLLNANGQGRFLVVLDPQDTSGRLQPYQGIVPLDGATVAEALEQYMLGSEQLPTRLWLAADGEQCAGLMLQRLPGSGGHAPADKARVEDLWDTLAQLFQTVGREELLASAPETLAHRLLWSYDVLMLESSRPHWHCPCTRQRVADMLRMLGRDEVDDIVREQGSVTVQCHFCGKPYRFDAVDSAALFVTPDQGPSGGSPTLH